MAMSRIVAAQLETLEKRLAAFDWVAGLYEGRELTRDDVASELADLQMIAGEVGEVYCHVTGGRISKPTTLAQAVIAVSDDHFSELVAEEIADSGLARAALDLVAAFEGADNSPAEPVQSAIDHLKTQLRIYGVTPA